MMREARTGGATPLRAWMPLPVGAAMGGNEAAEGVGTERAPVPALPAPPATNPSPPPRPQHRAFFTANGGGGPWDRAEGLARRRPVMALGLRGGGGDGSEARQDTTNQAETIWSADKHDAQVLTSLLPRAAYDRRDWPEAAACTATCRNVNGESRRGSGG